MDERWVRLAVEFYTVFPDEVDARIKANEEAAEELSTIANVMPAPPLPFLAPEHHGHPIVMAQIKARYDSDNLFRLNQNIPPD